jgi:hypothetical protein
MCCDNFSVPCSEALSFETFITDPLIRLMMDSDRVTTAEMVEVLEVARAAVAARAQCSLSAMAPAGHA